MFIQKILITITAGFLLILFSPIEVRADVNDHLYFIGMEAPIGSMSSDYTASDKRAVYLRWDMVEGKIPIDIQEFILYKNGNKVNVAFPAHQVMTAQMIRDIYFEPGQERRRFEIINWLNKEGVVAKPPYIVDVNNFHTIIYNRIQQKDSFWSMFASRIDFNVARAIHRGYLDLDIQNGVDYTYELKATNGTLETLVGRVAVKAGSPKVIESAVDFHQVFGISRCDAPERFKEHGTLYMNWREPGSNTVSRYANTLAISGYDLYRKINGTGFALDIRTAAMTIMHDSAGIVQISGYEKVNDQPILMSGTDKNDTRHEGWNAPYAQYMELPKKLKKAGIYPGDERTYYLVARDFTGNYGATVHHTVRIPDKTPPPAPWSIWTVPDSGYDPVSGTGIDTFKIAWQKTDVKNYFDANKKGKVYCNLPTARLDKKLSFVMEGQQCSKNVQQTISLDPDKYLIYRFDSVAAAEAFKDSDGDGYSDKDERIVNPNNPLLSTPGRACDYDTGLSYTNYLLKSVLARDSRISGEAAILEFVDNEPAVNKNKIYWYRIATQDHNGEISPLSAPIRAYFPRRDPPVRAKLGDGLTFGTRQCTYGVEDVSDDTSLFALDYTSDAAFVSIVDANAKAKKLITMELETFSGNKAWKSADLGDKLCREADVCISGGCYVHFLRGDGTLLKERAMEGYDCPMTRRYNLDTISCTSPTIIPVEWGQVVEPTLYLEVDPVYQDKCIKLYRDINGEAYPLKTYCPPDTLVPIEINVTGTDGSLVCLSASVQDEDAQTSLSWSLPCVRLQAEEELHTPLAADMQVNSSINKATLTWLPPKQETVGTILEWYTTGTDANGERRFYTQFVSEDNLQADGSQSLEVDISSEPTGTDWSEEWCFRARAVGSSGSANANSALSEWSEAACVLRREDTAPLPEYLEWPKITSPAKLGDMDVVYLSHAYDGFPVIILSNDMKLVDGEAGGGTCGLATGDHATGPCDQISTTVDAFTFCTTVRDAAAEHMGFVVYRQNSEDPSASTPIISEYKQVSPLIGQVGCRAGNRVEDPFILVTKIINSSPEREGDRVLYRDKYPHEGGMHYRYQLVYFDERGEITGYRQTNWVQAN